MLAKEQFVAQVRIETVVVETWIEAGWLVPQRQDHEIHFSEADIARARLILDLKHDLGVNDEGVGVILALVDQMHGLRRTIRDLSQALQGHDPQLRESIITALRRGGDAREAT